LRSHSFLGSVRARFPIGGCNYGDRHRDNSRKRIPRESRILRTGDAAGINPRARGCNITLLRRGMTYFADVQRAIYACTGSIRRRLTRRSP
jgi:hypothetical protein